VGQSRTSKVLALSLGQGLTAAVTLLTGVVLARMLTVGELATYRQTLLAYNIAAPILSLGLSSGLYYFLPNETKRARAIVVEGMLVMLFMGAIYSLFIACGGNFLLAQRFSNPNIEASLLYLIPYPLLTLPAGLLGAVLVVRGKVKQLTVFNVLSNLLLGVGVISVCILWADPQILIITFVVISLVNGLIAIILMLKAVPDGDGPPQLSNIKTLIVYSLPLALASMMGSIALQLDKFVVSAMRTPEEFAIYSNGAIEIPLIGMITGAISTVILVDMAAYCKNGHKEKALVLFKKGAVHSALILLPVMAFLMVYAEEFITILFSDKYNGSINIFRIYLGILPVRIVMYGAALMALNMTRVVLWRSIGDLSVNAVLSCLFVYYWGPYGAAYATVITLIVWTVPFNLKMIGKGFGCKWYEVLPLGPICKIAAISLFVALFSGLLTFIVDVKVEIFTFTLGAFVFGGLYLGLVWRMLVEGREAAMALFAKRGKVTPHEY
jgi:O-antigen/teichoic acid export membrane protein